MGRMETGPLESQQWLSSTLTRGRLGFPVVTWDCSSASLRAGPCACGAAVPFGEKAPDQHKVSRAGLVASVCVLGQYLTTHETIPPGGLARLFPLLPSGSPKWWFGGSRLLSASV